MQMRGEVFEELAVMRNSQYFQAGSDKGQMRVGPQEGGCFQHGGQICAGGWGWAGFPEAQRTREEEMFTCSAQKRGPAGCSQPCICSKEPREKG